MNPLETLKQKLKVKPNIEERKPVAIVIKGTEKVEKLKIPQSRAVLMKPNLKTYMEEKEEGELEEDELEEGEEIELEKEEEKVKKQEKNILKATAIIDETHKGFNRKDLLQKLIDSGLKKVIANPVLETSQIQEQQIISPQIIAQQIVAPQIQNTPIEELPQPIKKARKAKKKVKLIIEEDEPEQIKPVKFVPFLEAS
jgi:hypothetical protein